MTIIRFNVFRFICMMALLSPSSISYAQELQWELVSARKIGGGKIACDKNSVSILGSGASVAVLFDEMRASLIAGDHKGKVERGVCEVTLKIILPQGYYLDSAQSSITAGTEKSVGSRVTIDSRMSISAIKILDKSETYTRQNAVSEPLIQMTDSKEFPMSQKRQFCRLTKAGSNDVRMIVQVGVGAIRADESKTAIVSIDSGDSSYALGMKMGKCRDIKAD